MDDKAERFKIKFVKNHQGKLVLKKKPEFRSIEEATEAYIHLATNAAKLMTQYTGLWWAAVFMSIVAIFCLLFIILG